MEKKNTQAKKVYYIQVIAHTMTMYMSILFCHDKGIHKTKDEKKIKILLENQHGDVIEVLEEVGCINKAWREC